MSASRPDPTSTDDSADLAAWIVRGGQEGDTVMYNLEENVVTLGWGNWIADGDAFESADPKALDRIFDQRFAKEHPRSVRRRGRQEILRFRDRVRTNDLAVLPLKNHGSPDALIAIGKVMGPAVFDPDRPEGALLRRPVTWLAREVAESVIQPDLRSSIKNTRLTVFQPRADDATSRILHIVTHGEDPGPHNQQTQALSGEEAGVTPEHGQEIPEGAKTQVMVNRYERDPVARRRCLEHFGHECQVCGLRFEDRYGDIGQGYMHVHHKTPLSEITDHANHTVNPLEDLVPLCPNCHAMIHAPKGKALTVEELRRRMDEASGELGVPRI